MTKTKKETKQAFAIHNVRRSTYAVRMNDTHRTYAIFEDRQHALRYARNTMGNDAYVEEIYDEEIDKYFA